MYKRLLTPLLVEALSDSPVVLLNGARQTGKTTLVQNLPSEHHTATYITLDDAGFLSAARSDPAGFLAGLPGPVVIDEVQHAPELFPAIKAEVDTRRAPGRFLLTGSANVLLLPKLSESLAGRMEILTLWPLSQAEVEGSSGSFVDGLFSPELSLSSMADGAGRMNGADKANRVGINRVGADQVGADRTDIIRRILRGGYPEPQARANEIRRRAWFNSYLTTILQRDVRDISNIEGLRDLPRLLGLLAARAGGLLNLADISRAHGLPYATLYRYMSLLEATFLVQPLPAWSANIGRRLVKAPKVILNDTGLMASLLGADAERLKTNGELLGGLLENFVVMEVRKDAGWSRTQPGLFHYRTQTGQEVDLVLEDAAGRLVGIEVKASATITLDDFKGLRHLAEAVGGAEAAGGRFVRGVVFYTGEKVIPFGANLHALPVSSLWTSGL